MYKFQKSTSAREYSLEITVPSFSRISRASRITRKTNRIDAKFHSPIFQMVAHTHGGETIAVGAREQHFAKGTERIARREPNQRSLFALQSLQSHKDRLGRALLELQFLHQSKYTRPPSNPLHTKFNLYSDLWLNRTETRQNNSDRPGEGQDDGPGAPRLQGQDGQHRQHVLSPQREVRQQPQGGLRGLHQSARQQTGRAHRYDPFLLYYISADFA